MSPKLSSWCYFIGIQEGMEDKRQVKKFWLFSPLGGLVEFFVLAKIIWSKEPKRMDITHAHGVRPQSICWKAFERSWFSKGWMVLTLWIKMQWRNTDQVFSAGQKKPLLLNFRKIREFWHKIQYSIQSTTKHLPQH